MAWGVPGRPFALDPWLTTPWLEFEGETGAEPMATNNMLTNSRRRRGRHRKPTAHQPYSWLGSAAFTLGMGAVLFGGSAGIAHADGSTSAGAPSSAGSDGVKGAPPDRDAATPAARRAAARSGADGADVASPVSSGRAARPVAVVNPVARGGAGSPLSGLHPAAAALPRPAAGRVTPPGGMPAAGPEPDLIAAGVLLDPPRIPPPVAAASSQPVSVLPGLRAPAITPAPAAVGGSAAGSAAVPGVQRAPATAVVAPVQAPVPGGDPLAPAQAAVSWVAAAAARRETEAVAATVPAAATVSSGPGGGPAGAAAAVATVTRTPIPAASPGRTRSEFRNYGAFAAVKTDGTVVTWGSPGYGGDSAGVAGKLTGVVSFADPFNDDRLIPVPPRANTAPMVSKVTVGTAVAGTGVVSGSVTATDADKDTLTYSAPASTAKGSVTINASTGALTYTPTAAARHGAARTGATSADKSDTVSVTVKDGFGGVVTVPVTVIISPNNAVPVTKSTVGAPNASTGVVAGSVTATDADKDTLAYSAPASTAKGSVTINASTGVLTYTPTAAARHGAARVGASAGDKSDTVTVTVSDGYGGVVAVPLTVAISPKNTAPTATVSVAKPDSVTGIAKGVVTASDADKDTLTYTASKPANGAVTVNADGSFAYTPNSAARARASASWTALTDTFTIHAADGYGGSKSVTVTATIAPTYKARAAAV